MSKIRTINGSIETISGVAQLQNDNERLVYAGCGDGSVYIVNADTGLTVATISGGVGRINDALPFINNDIVVGLNGGRIRRYTQGGTQVWEHQETGWSQDVRGISLNAKEDITALTLQGTKVIKLNSAGEKQWEVSMSGSGGGRCCSFSPNQQHIATGNTSGRAIILKDEDTSATEVAVLTGLPDCPGDIHWIDDEYLILVDANGTSGQRKIRKLHFDGDSLTQVWELGQREGSQNFGRMFGISLVRSSNDFFVGDFDGYVYKIRDNGTSGELLWQFQHVATGDLSNNLGVHQVACRPDGSEVFSCSYDKSVKKIVEVNGLPVEVWKNDDMTDEVKEVFIKYEKSGQRPRVYGL